MDTVNDTTYSSNSPSVERAPERKESRKRESSDITPEPPVAADCTIAVAGGTPSSSKRAKFERRNAKDEKQKKEEQGEEEKDVRRIVGIENVPDSKDADTDNYDYVCQTAGDVTINYAQQVAKMLPRKPIRELYLSFSHIDNEAMVTLAKGLENHPWLEVLIISWAGFGNKGASAIAKVIASPRSRLEKLGIRFSKIRDNGAQAIAKALSDPLCVLRSLSLQSHNIGSRGFYAIGHALTVNISLEDIEVSHTHRGMSFSEIHPELAARDFATDLRKNTRLQALNLANINLRKWQASELCRGLADHPSIEELDLSRNDDGFTLPEDVEGLLSLIGSGGGALRVLKVNYCDLGKDFWKGLPQAMRTNHSLERLHLKALHGGDEVSYTMKRKAIKQILAERAKVDSSNTIEIPIFPNSV